MHKSKEIILKKKIIMTIFGLLFSFFFTLLSLQTPAFAEPRKVEEKTTENSSFIDYLNGNPDEKTESEDNNNISNYLKGNPDESKNSPDDSKNDSNSKSEENTENANFLEKTWGYLKGEDTKDTNSTGDTCKDQSGAVGWIVCPSTGAIAKATDAIYSLIENMLIVNPKNITPESTVHIVWEYVRNITNIIFIIFLLIVICSQLTGVGISNYGIKRVLPRIVISTILVNLSFIICQLGVDISNLIGSGLRETLMSIEQKAIESGITKDISVSWADAFTGIMGTGMIAGAAITITGGLGTLFWTAIPIILGALVSIIIGLVTITLRQGLVIVLVMIAPLAFVCYLLPNTESWFKKWKNLLMKMLTFYPIFSFLFGASHLAGWAIITSSVNKNNETDGFGVLVGMAVQIFPLFFSWSLMKMSGTILGTINSRLNNLTSKPLSAINKASAERAALRRAEYTERQLRKPFNPFSGSSWNARIAQRQVDRADRLKTAQDNIGLITSNDLNARKRGTKVIGYDKDGMPIYSSKYRNTDELKREYRNRVLKLNTSAANSELENTMSTMGTHLKEHGIQDAELISLTNAQAQNFLESKTQAVAAKINARSDQRFYSEQVTKASKRDSETNELLNPDLYKRLIERGAGADYYVDTTLTGEALAEAKKHSQASTVSVIADAYDAIENERKITTGQYTTFFGRQVTKEVLRQYRGMLDNKNIDGIIAAQNTLAFRGDYDKIGSYLGEYLDRGDYAEIETDFTNALALNLLSMKDADPKLARLGKHMNVETWHYTNHDESSGEPRRSKFITMDEFYTGKDRTGVATKYYAPTLMQGTPVKGIDRTYYGDLKQDIEKYYTAEYFGTEAKAQQEKEALYNNMMPQIISAVPTYNSGSEPLINTMNFLTGVKYDSVSDVWYPDWYKKNSDGSWRIDRPVETTETAQERLKLTKKYLSSMTPNDVINMKTDAFKACMLRLKIENGYNFSEPESSATNTAATNRAELLFRQIFTDNGVIARLNSSDPGALVAMKGSVKKALGLT